MKTGMLVGLGVALVAAGGLVYAKSKAPKAPAGEKPLTPALEAELKRWLDALDADNIGKASHQKPSPAVVAGATVFAGQLMTAGYPTEANALAAAIAVSQS